MHSTTTKEASLVHLSNCTISLCRITRRQPNKHLQKNSNQSKIMRSKKIFLPWFMLCTFAISVQITEAQSVQKKQADEAISPGAKLLFTGVESRLSNADKNYIFKKTGFVLTADKKEFAQDNSALEYPFQANAYPVDFNKDGVEEVFVDYGNTYTSGNTGVSFFFFIPDQAGVYQEAISLIGIPVLLKSGNAGYPDIEIGGPGFKFPIWRFNGKSYNLYRKAERYVDSRNNQLGEIAEISAKYRAGLKKNK